jgi:transcriptional regulator with XRE-family HTH domain
MGFTENLRYLRKKFDVTQSLLAEEIHVPPILVRTWEQNGLTPDDERLERIASYFQVSRDWLLADHMLDSGVPLKNNPLDWKPKKPRLKRECLKCNRKFLSVGPHNRICDRCKKVPNPSNDLGDKYRLHSVKF